MATVSRGGTSERLGFIQRYGQDLGISYLHDWLGVSRSDYYAWLTRTASQRAIKDKTLSTRIRQIHEESRHTYGSLRVHEALKKQGISIGKKRVERLIQAQGLQGRVVQAMRRQPVLKRFIERG